MINTLMNCGLEIDEEEEVEDMCTAWEEMRKDTERLGLEKGRLTFIANLMDSSDWIMEQAMDAMKIPKNERLHYTNKLKS